MTPGAHKLKKQFTWALGDTNFVFLWQCCWCLSLVRLDPPFIRTLIVIVVGCRYIAYYVKQIILLYRVCFKYRDIISEIFNHKQFVLIIVDKKLIYPANVWLKRIVLSSQTLQFFCPSKNVQCMHVCMSQL